MQRYTWNSLWTFLYFLYTLLKEKKSYSSEWQKRIMIKRKEQKTDANVIKHRERLILFEFGVQIKSNDLPPVDIQVTFTELPSLYGPMV